MLVKVECEDGSIVLMKVRIWGMQMVMGEQQRPEIYGFRKCMNNCCVRSKYQMALKSEWNLPSSTSQSKEQSRGQSEEDWPWP